MFHWIMKLGLPFCGFLISINAFSADYPLGLMSVPITRLRDISEAGFSVAHSYQFEMDEVGYQEPTNNEKAALQYLNEAQKNNLKVMMGFSRFAVRQLDIDYLERRVRLLKGHPALYAWYLYDEPEGGGESHRVDPECLAQAYRIIKAIDSHHPVVVTTYSVVGKDSKIFDALDVIATDQYPIPMYPPNQILSRLIPAKIAAEKLKKQSWSILQAHDSGLYRVKTGTGFPSRIQMQFMAYLSIVRGASGVWFYCFSDGVNDLGAPDNSAHWNALTDVAQELRNTLQLTRGGGFVGATYFVDGSIEVFTKRTTGGTLLITINNSDKKVSKSIDLSHNQLSMRQIDVLYERRKLHSMGHVSDTWEPWARHVYMVR